MRIGTKSLLCCRSSRLVSGIHPLSSGSSPSPSRLWTRLLRHPAFPLVHQLLLVRTSWYLLWSFIYSYVCYADRMNWSALKYTRHRPLASLHRYGAWGDTCGGKLALRAGGRRQRWNMKIALCPHRQLFHHWKMKFCHLFKISTLYKQIMNVDSTDSQCFMLPKYLLWAFAFALF